MTVTIEIKSLRLTFSDVAPETAEQFAKRFLSANPSEYIKCIQGIRANFQMPLKQAKEIVDAARGAIG